MTDTFALNELLRAIRVQERAHYDAAPTSLDARSLAVANAAPPKPAGLRMSEALRAELVRSTPVELRDYWGDHDGADYTTFAGLPIFIDRSSIKVGILGEREIAALRRLR